MTELWYRLSLLGEKRFFEQKRFIDGLVIPANLIAYYEIALPELLANLQLPFIVDPVTYLWELDPRTVHKDGELKKSFVKLVERLDCQLANMLGTQRISMIKKDSPEFQEFVHKVLGFQARGEDAKKTPRHYSMERIKRYRKQYKKEESTIHPYALIPPYFHFITADSSPYEKTTYAAKLAKDSVYGEKFKIFPCLCMDKSILLEESLLDKILEDFKSYQGVIFWINEFDETKASQDELQGFASLVSRFHEAGVRVANLFGGYFSLMLSQIGLSMLSSGICYLRYKNVFAKGGGGGLPIRYYEPHLKRKLLGDDMFRLYMEMPKLFDCACPVCAKFSRSYRLLKSSEEKEQLLNDFFGILGSAREIKKSGVISWTTSREHFLYNRKKEQEYLEKSDLSKVTSDMRKAYDSLQKDQLDPNWLHPIDSFEYLKRWVDSLAREISKSK